MIIGFDGSRIAKQFHTGTEVYSTELLKAISKIDQKNQYIIYSPKPITERLGQLPKNFSYKILPFPKFWSQIRLSWEIVFGYPKPDVMFMPAHTMPIIYHQKSVIGIMDLGFLHFPKLFTPFERFYHKWNVNYAVKHSSHIITISEYTKADIVKYFKIKPDKNTVTYLGIDNDFANCQPKHPDINERYIFFVGRLEEKKNIKGLIKAYSLLRSNNKITHKLVLAGKPGYNYQQIKQEINNLPNDIKKDIIELGYLNENELTSWMHYADIFFFPSFFEGFGIPIIEAMASGVPVIASNTTSIPEIAGEAAILVDPDDYQQMSKQLENLITNPDLRSKLIVKGKLRAKEFTWQKTATKTLKIINKVATDQEGI